jgi:hypothetical protein
VRATLELADLAGGLSLDDITEGFRLLERGEATCDNQAPRLKAVVRRIDGEIERPRETRETIVRLMARCEGGKCTRPDVPPG